MMLRFAANATLPPKRQFRWSHCDVQALTVVRSDKIFSVSGAELRLVRDHLERILSTRPFERAPRLRMFLRFIVEETLAGRSGQLKEYTIGTDVYGRSATFDPRLDATIRVEAGKLRNRLEEYYSTIGARERVRILLRKGSYAPDISITRDADPTETSELYVRGIELLGQRTAAALEEAYECFWTGVVRYPQHSQAYEGLAAYYAIAGALELLSPTEAWPRTRMAIAQARALNYTGTLTDLTLSALAYATGDGTHAEAIARRVVTRSPNDPTAHFYYSGIMSAQARHSQSLEHMRKAAALAARIAPESSNAILFESHVSWSLYHAGSYTAARDHLRERFGAHSSNVVVQYLQGRILAEMGEYDQAIQSLMAVYAAVPIPMVEAALGYAIGRAGRRTEAEAILDRLRSTSQSCYVSPVRTAVIHRALGQYKAFADELAAVKQDYAMIWAQVDPQLARR